MKKIIPILLIILITSMACTKLEKMLTPAEQLAEDIAQIEEFLLLNKLVAQSTPSGLYYIIKNEGVGTSHPALQDSVTLKYKGFYISDGTIFDQTPENDSVTFKLNELILGWQEGIQLFKKESSGMLFLPSKLAYGPYPPMGVRPNAVMVFEIEVLNFSH